MSREAGRPFRLPAIGSGFFILAGIALLLKVSSHFFSEPFAEPSGIFWVLLFGGAFLLVTGLLNIRSSKLASTESDARGKGSEPPAPPRSDGEGGGPSNGLR